MRNCQNDSRCGTGSGFLNPPGEGAAELGKSSIRLVGWRIAELWLQSILLEAEMFSLLLTISTAIATITTITIVTIAITIIITINIVFRAIGQGQIDQD